MLFYWIFISFAFVNILADYKNYSDEVKLTNAYIDSACKTTVPKTFYSGFDMTIKNIVRGDNYTFEEMNYMLALPDYAEDNTNLENIIRYQEIMRNEIINSKSRKRFVIQIKKGQTSTTPESIRRTTTTKAIRGLLALDILQGKDVNYTPLQKCYLIGLAIQSKDILSYYTASACIENDTCVLRDKHGNVKKYKEIGNEFWVSDCDEPKRLIDQLKDNKYVDSQ